MQMLVCRERGDPRDEDESAIRRAELEAANASSTAGNAETAKRARTRLDRLREHRYLYPHGRMSPIMDAYVLSHSSHAHLSHYILAP